MGWPPPDTFCRAVQELHQHLALVIEESNWPYMEEEIQAGVMNDPMVAALLRPPTPRRIPSQIPGVEKPMASNSPSASELEGMTPPQDLAPVPRRQLPPPPGFSPQFPEDLVLPALEGAYLLGTPALFDLSTLESLEVTISHTQQWVKSIITFRLRAWLG